MILAQIYHKVGVRVDRSSRRFNVGYVCVRAWKHGVICVHVASGGHDQGRLVLTGPWKGGRGAGRARRGSSVIVVSKKRVHVNLLARPQFLPKRLPEIDPEQGHRPTVSRVEGSISLSKRSLFWQGQKARF